MNTHKLLAKGLCRSVLSLVLAVIIPLDAIAIPAAATTGILLDRLNAPPPPALPPSVRRGAGAVKLHSNKLAFSGNPSDAELSRARIFSEPLLPMTSRPVHGENLALARAVISYKTAGNPEDISALDNFIAAYPNSGWRASLELSIAEIRFEAGYLTDALKLWRSSWNRSKMEKGQAQSDMANAAISHLLVLEARLGRMDTIKNDLLAIEHRHLSGSDETRVRSVREGLISMIHHPEIAFKCGPYALNSLLYGTKRVTAVNPVLAKAASTVKGTNLPQLIDWAAQVGLRLQAAKRGPSAPIVVPCVMHFKVGHFAAITAERDGMYQVKDPTFDFAGNRWMSSKAIDAESDGYFLVPIGALPAGWHAIAQEEAQTVWGKGDSANSNPDATTPYDSTTSPGPSPDSCHGMAKVAFFNMRATSKISDVPLTYTPPIGPPIEFLIDYNYLENNQPSTFTFSNLGKDWTFNWLSYLTLDASKNATVRVRGGGSQVYTNTGSTGSPAYADPDINSQCALAIVGGNYELLLPDGSIELFNDTDGSGRIFMTQVFDPQGNATSIQYDSDFRIISITDAIGQVSTVSYASNTYGASGFYNITQISDPFGRTAAFSYDSTYAYLLSITDQIGLVSQFAYDTGSDFITLMTTPYGSTALYQYTPANPGSYGPVGLRVTLPDGSSTVVENWMGLQCETFYWDREAMAQYPNDYTNSINPVYSGTWHCAVTQWQLFNVTGDTESSVPNWYQPALVQAGTDVETHYTYAGSTYTGDRDHYWVGTTNKPATVVQNSSTWQYTYNSFGHVTQAIDPAGRTFSYSYASNNIDLTEAKQTQGSNDDILGQWIYNQFASGTAGAPLQHRPLAYIDGSGQRSVFSYNAYGELTQRADPNGNVSTLTYGSIPGNPLPVYLTQVQGPLAGDQDVTTFTYDGYGRVYTATDSEGYTRTFSYDNADRLTQVTYPDGTFEQIVYDRLDAVLHKDRIGRWSQDAYDNMDQLSFSSDPLGRKTKFTWCTCGSLMCFTDPMGRTTSFQHDLEGRVIGKTYPDSTQYSYAYNSYGLLQSRTDALSQVANYVYNADLSLAQTSYSGAVNPTSTVSSQYDANYPRLTNTANGSSSLSYGYNPYITSGTGIATITLGGSPTTGDVLTVTVGNTTATNIALAGAPSTGDVVNVLVFNNSLSGGMHNVQYTVLSTDTNLSILASSVKSAINSDSTLSTAGISATANGSVVFMSSTSSAGPISILPNTNGVSTETVGGTINIGDVVSVTVFDAGIPQNLSSGLPSGQRTYSYTVTSGDSTTNIADQLATAINADTTLSGLGITASWTSGHSYFTIASTSVNQTQVDQAVNPSGHETIALSGGPSEAAPTAVLLNSPTTVSYTVLSSDTTLTTLAASIKSAINATTALSNAGVGATSNSSFGVIYLTAPEQFGVPSVSVSASSAATETIATSVAGTVNMVGAPSTGDRVNVTVMNGLLPGGSQTIQYPVLSTDTSASILASSVATAINSNSKLVGAHIAASANGSIVSITAPPSADTVSIVSSTNGTVTETLTYSGSSGDTFSITAFDALLPGGQKTETYIAGSADTASSIASALTAQINADMASAGITATGSSGVMSIKSASVNGTFYKQSATGSSSISQGGGASEIASAGGDFGAGRLHSTFNTAINNATTTYLYDSLGRTVNRSINGPANSTNLAIDQISRITGESNPLGGFNFSYINNVIGISKGDSRLSSISYPNGQAASFSYLPNINDQRLQQIANLNIGSAPLSQFNYAYDPAGQIKQWQQQSSSNSHFDLGYDLAGQLVSAQVDSGSIFNAYISGTVHAGDVVSVTAYDASLVGTSPIGQETASYTVMSGDNASSIASALASAIGSVMSNLSVTGSASGSVVSISTSSNFTTSFTCNVSGSEATDTIALSQSEAIQPLHKQQYYSYDCAGNRTGVQGDSTGSFPAGLTTNATQASYNCTNELTSTAAGGPIAFQATTVNPVKSAVVNVTQTATVGGSVTTGDVLFIGVHDPGLSHAEVVSYTVPSSSTTTSIATGIKNAINADSTLSSLGVSATSSGAVITISSTSANPTIYSQATGSGATETITLGTSLGMLAAVNPSDSFTANPSLSSGANTASVTAVSGGGTAATHTYPITINAANSQSFSFDANGGMTGVNASSYRQYGWDAEHRLVKISYDNTGNNYTSLNYDAAGNFSQIAETQDAVTTVTNLVWCEGKICEARDLNSKLLNQFFAYGQKNFTGHQSANFYYVLDHLGNIVQVVDASGNVVAQYSYSPWGEVTVISESVRSAFGFAGMYQHQRSGLNLTMYRAYNPALGRWLSRDPIGEEAGTNLYGYVDNNPISGIDRLGLEPPSQQALPGIINVMGGSRSAQAGQPSGFETGGAFNIAPNGNINWGASGIPLSQFDVGIPRGGTDVYENHSHCSGSFVNPDATPLSDIQQAQRSGRRLWVVTPNGQVNMFDAPNMSTGPDGTQSVPVYNLDARNGILTPVGRINLMGR